MLLDCSLSIAFVYVVLCCMQCYGQGQIFQFRDNNGLTTTPAPPLPFPTCRADDIDCLRRGLRTFFFLMDQRHFDMEPIDPFIINSVALNFGDDQTSFLLRRVNVTGARWTKLVDRRFNLVGGKSGVVFKSDLHATGEILMKLTDRLDPYVALITMDIHCVGFMCGSPYKIICYGRLCYVPILEEVESNITYTWTGERRVDNEDYIIVGPERIAVRNVRLPTYFLHPINEDSLLIDQELQGKPSAVDHLANELVAALMHGIVDNFRVFAYNVPVKYFYKYY